jgi:hypothetical protein
MKNTLLFLFYLLGLLSCKTEEMSLKTNTIGSVDVPINAILAHAEKTLTIKRNDFLTLRGSIDTNLYYIQNGSLQIFMVDNEEEKIIRFGYEGNFIVLLDSFLTG